MKSFSESYRQAGVDITAGYKAVELMKKHVARARLYIILEPLPNIKPIIKILTMETSAASFHVYLSSTKSTARFARPSFIPGIPAKNGINDSTYPKIMAMAANSPRYAVFF